MARRIRWRRALLAGAAGGSAGLVGLMVAFGLGAPIILDPDLQSPKLIAVWTTMEPLPKAVFSPLPVYAGFVLLGALHGITFAMMAPSLPGRGWKKGWTFGALLWSTMALFFEFYTPWNMFHEPALLVLFELALWAVGMLLWGLTTAAIYREA